VTPSPNLHFPTLYSRGLYSPHYLPPTASIALRRPALPQRSSASSQMPIYFPRRPFFLPLPFRWAHMSLRSKYVYGFVSVAPDVRWTFYSTDPQRAPFYLSLWVLVLFAVIFLGCLATTPARPRLPPSLFPQFSSFPFSLFQPTFEPADSRAPAFSTPFTNGSRRLFFVSSKRHRPRSRHIPPVCELDTALRLGSPSVRIARLAVLLYEIIISRGMPLQCAPIS